MRTWTDANTSPHALLIPTGSGPVVTLLAATGMANGALWFWPGENPILEAMIGATMDGDGRIRLATGETVFFSPISDMPEIRDPQQAAAWWAEQRKIAETTEWRQWAEAAVRNATTETED